MFYVILENNILTQDNKEALTRFYDNVQELENVTCNEYYKNIDKYKLIDSKLEDISQTSEYLEAKILEREIQFNKDFFLTSLGYVRRKAYIQGTGETKDFLSDCLPVLCNAFALGQNIKAIIYDKPSMLEDVTNWIQYQKTGIDWANKTIQQTFLAECLIQYQKDFFGN